MQNPMNKIPIPSLNGCMKSSSPCTFAMSLIRDSSLSYVSGNTLSISFSKALMHCGINWAAGNRNPPFDIFTVRYFPANEYNSLSADLCICWIYFSLNFVLKVNLSVSYSYVYRKPSNSALSISSFLFKWRRFGKFHFRPWIIYTCSFLNSIYRPKSHIKISTVHYLYLFHPLFSVKSSVVLSTNSLYGLSMRMSIARW